MLRRVIVSTVVAITALCASAEDRSYGRSMVVTPYGIVATSYVQASQAGARILEQGGSAIDAGIAANAVLGVAEPMMNGIGGDLFAIYWDAKTGKLYGLNASGWAPQGLTIDHLEAKGLHSMPQSGIDSVTVPGAVDGWSKLHEKFGKLAWSELFQPAIFYAGHGYAVPEAISAYWEEAAPDLAPYAESRRVYLPDGKAPATGQLFRNPDLARALTIIAEQGEAGFYKGDIAKAILKTSSKLGGTMTADDLSQYAAEWVEPISTTYRDWTVYELPPNGDGMAALEMLNIMENSKPGIDEVSLRRREGLRWRPEIWVHPGQCLDLQAVRCRASLEDQLGPRQLRGRPGRPAQERHHLSLGRRPGRKHPLSYPEQLRSVWI
jgi:gamma-glutamyltranspeptidase/glutathione hydrolase